eukprot:TRINITY_DN37272_c0_g1_i1.p1 TRINITY_DN37272_c0_g1~~TRINITY_DN37272_c0_g1_i1.p1  ORF type:complete len:516 (-),score=44.00 TRINITY_DN37272_c0_g1_i1:263-1810(-)
MTASNDDRNVAGVERKLRLAFVFPKFAGHVNPSLPVARRLVEMGHAVHYLVHEDMRAAIEGTGSCYHSLTDVFPDDLPVLIKEFGLQDNHFFLNLFLVEDIRNERHLQSVLHWLSDLNPDVVVYCPLACAWASYASKVHGIPSVALLTTAGPGSVEKLCEENLKKANMSPLEFQREIAAFGSRRSSVDRVQARYGLRINSSASSYSQQVGWLECLADSYATLITTSRELQDPMTVEVQNAYSCRNTRFLAVGPLLDKDGAGRACANQALKVDGEQQDVDVKTDIIAQVRAARADQRPVVLVSMGTVVTGDHGLDTCWDTCGRGPDGRCLGLTGRQICQAVWGAAFDAFGSQDAVQGSLIIAVMGPQSRPLGDVVPPPNALCLPVVPQVDILRIGVDLFITHGGQNSFTEALAHETPMVVCPVFGDQIVNAAKAETIGVGLQVPRPYPGEGEEGVAAMQYRKDVAMAARRVLEGGSFRIAAKRCADGLQKVGGVPRAVEVILEAGYARFQYGTIVA